MDKHTYTPYREVEFFHSENDRKKRILSKWLSGRYLDAITRGMDKVKGACYNWSTSIEFTHEQGALR